ncbi:MAG: glycoside hydrolase family 65 protein [Desulfatibacillaceae bacterium]
MNPWTLVYEGYKPEEEGLREALCTLGNGFFCTRGAAPEVRADGTHYPGTYIAGGYNRLQSEVSGEIVENEDLVNMPNWLPMTFRLEDGPWFRVPDMNIIDYRLELDIRRAVLIRDLRFEDGHGRITRVVMKRLVHMSHPHVAAQQMEVTPQNWSGPIEFRTALDGSVTNQGVERYQALAGHHLRAMEAHGYGDDGLCVVVRTTQSGLGVAVAEKTRIYDDSGRRRDVGRRVLVGSSHAMQMLRTRAVEGRPVVAEKIVGLYTSQDPAVSEIGMAAREEASICGRFDALLDSHATEWRHLWRAFEIRVGGVSGEREKQVEHILYLHTLHLLQTASVNTMVLDLDVGIPSRGWHGEAYRGHILWDELFIFPVLNLRLPEITRQVLLYRYRRLKAARGLAHEAGLEGGMYPWQSGSDGREESQRIHLNPRSGRWIPDNSRLQRHVSSAIAYNVYHYYQVTEDMEFLSFYGGEMILEIARFWASIARLDEESGRYGIRGVMGPDEYHEAYPDADEPGLDNNAYTNVMAVWVISRALDLHAVLPEEACDRLTDKLGLTVEELKRWDDITRRMKVPFHGDGIISQFEGYENLEEFDWEGYREKYGDIQRLDRILESEGDSPNRYKLSKQADVLMLFYLFSAEELEELFARLGYDFSTDRIPENVEYYLARTAHGSTLSKMVHSWVTSRSHRKEAWDLYREALMSDVKDVQGGTTPEGIHLGAMAGTVDLMQRCYTGLVTRRDVLWFDPCLPQGLTELDFQLKFRGCFMRVEVTREKLKLTVLKGREMPVKVGFRGEAREIRGGESHEFHLHPG